MPHHAHPARSICLALQVVVEGPSASAELHNLTSSTEYLVSVAPVYEAGVGEGLRGLVTTGGWGGGLGSGPGVPLGAWHQPGGYVGQLPVLTRVGAPAPTCCETKAESLDLSDPQCPLPNTSDIMCVTLPQLGPLPALLTH